uniref:TAFII55 protein conserved region domain-containing protein n=1 Tax=Salix viminalis TaxID=40686 RepID=A0A6N2K7A3_SALVM
MEEQFILRVTPSIAEKLDRLLSETASSSEEQSLDLSFSEPWPIHEHGISCFAEDGRSGTFIIGNEHFPASLLDLPCVVESYKTYDDCALVKTADIGQMIMVREAGDTAPDVVEYRHGLTPPMRDARKRRFRREPYLNPELVQRVEKDLLNIMAGGTVENADILSIMHIFSIVFSAQRELEVLQLLANHSESLTEFLQAEANEQEEDGEQNARKANKKPEPAPEAKPDVPETTAHAEEPERSDSDESEDSMQ